MIKQTKSTRAADLLAERLYEAGCRYAFGMPGGEVLTIVDALEKAGIHFVLCKHENNAGFMAEGVMHRSGAPAILVATVGPGAVNGVNVVANAEQDRVPMIVITGCVDETETLTYTHQVLDHQAVFRPITKATFRLTAQGADIVADKAVCIATQSRCGPVHIDVPISVADEMVTPDKIRRRPPAATVIPGESAELRLARQWLSEATKPIMVIGLDAVAENAGQDIHNFCETHNVPFVTTYKAKGIVPESHRLCLGGAGLSPLADKHLLPLVRSADLIICAGYDPIEMRTGWREVWDPENTHVIDVAAVPNHHYMHQAGINFVANTGATLKLLSEGVTPRSTWIDDAPQKVRESLSTAFSTQEFWGPAAIIDECRKALPETALATADSGAHRILLSQMWNCYEPRGLIQSSALCTMGCAVPMAIGEKLASPERQVVSFSGDAGFLMVAGELSTAAELGGNPIFIVFVDASLALIDIKQRQRELANVGVDFGLHDYASIGKAFGGNGFTVSSRDQLVNALEKAQASEKFSVIAALIEPHAYDGII